MDIKNNCSLPFTGIQIDTDGRLSPCCMYKNEFDPDAKIYKIDQYQEYWSKEAPRIQQGFANNNYSKGCNTCFDLKNDITTKLRHFATETFFFKSNNLIQTNTPEWLDLRFGNYCNLKCIMCHANLSSQIYAEQFSNLEKFNSIGIKPAEFNCLSWWEDPQLLNIVFDMVQKAKYISFSGGEPLLAKQFYDILTHTNKDCTIVINTNLTKLTDRHLETLKEFQNVKINVSLDGVGKHHEYIRYGSKWSTIESNLLKLKENKKLTVSLTYLLQHTSIYTFPDFLNFINELNCEVTLSTVYSESVGGNHMMTINSVLPNKVDSFRSWLISHPNRYQRNLKQWLNMYEFNQEAHIQFKKYVNLLDELRGCNFNSTFDTGW